MGMLHTVCVNAEPSLVSTVSQCRFKHQAMGLRSKTPLIDTQVALASGTLITICDVSFWFLLPRRSALPSLPAAQSRHVS